MERKLIFLYNDRYIYTKLEDGTRGIPVLRVEEQTREGSEFARMVVECYNAMEGINHPETVMRYLREVRVNVGETMISLGTLVNDNDKMLSEIGEMKEAMLKAKNLLLKGGITVDNADVYNLLNKFK